MKRSFFRSTAALAAGFACILSFCIPAAADDELQCEVMSVEGTVRMKPKGGDSKVNLKEGDLLHAGDTVLTESGASADIALDKHWRNVVRVEEKSRAQVKSITPGVLALDEGGVYAKLGSLPKDSTFEIETPTGVAAVRGTEYRAEYKDGAMDVLNFSDSQVFVFGLDTGGKISQAPVVLKNGEKTGAFKQGFVPKAPLPMQPQERQRMAEISDRVEKRIDDVKAAGRVGKIQDVQHMERVVRDMQAGQGALVSMDASRREEFERRMEFGERQAMMMRQMENAAGPIPAPAPGAGPLVPMTPQGGGTQPPIGIAPVAPGSTQEGVAPPPSGAESPMSGTAAPQQTFQPSQTSEFRQPVQPAPAGVYPPSPTGVYRPPQQGAYPPPAATAPAPGGTQSPQKPPQGDQRRTAPPPPAKQNS